MIISKSLYNDKKEKHNSIELRITVPCLSLDEVPKELVGGYISGPDYTLYCFDFSSVEEADAGFKVFLGMLSTHYNRHPSTFQIKEQYDRNK